MTDKNHAYKPRSAGDIQLEQLARELETEEGLKRLADDAYQEALAAEKRAKPPTVPTKR